MRRRIGWWSAIASYLLPIGANLLWSTTTTAQVIPDGTHASTVSQSGNDFTITNGKQVGSNLFHSFSQFSVPTGGSAFFNNAPLIQSIFARVTGGTTSTIDGVIRANGTANLFLMNPAGILFGPNARLNLGGSFLATTAASIRFADGTQFSATPSQTASLLTVSVPIGLQMGNNPGPITIQGTGHTAQFDSSSQIAGLNLGSRGLQLQPGKTLALVGGDLTLTGGLLSAPGGRVELGSVTSGNVALSPSAQGFGLGYANATSFGNIQMTQRSLVSTRDLSLGDGGSIHIQGNQVNVNNGSLILVQNRSNRVAGDITVNAMESLHISGKSSNFLSSSALVNETVAAGAAGQILINTPLLKIDQGGFVLDRTFSSAPGGDIIVNTNDLQISGFALGDPSPFRAVSQLVTSSHARGTGGNLSISTQNLFIAAGANVAARPFGTGNGGNVTVKADTIQVTSAGAPAGNYYSLLSTATFGLGDSGNLKIDTRTLEVQAGGRVSASSIILGNAGNLTINASEFIEVSGIKDALNPSYIGTSVRPVGGFSNARAGETTITTPILNIRDGATVFVQNLGSGQAGTLTINANRLQLDNGASISASTKSGGGGNINLQVRDLLVMRRGSVINAEAGGNGNGGNITITAPLVVGFENSDIIANAFQGRGGNIQITTKGIFGLKFRSQLTPANDITASSQFGVSGTVQVNTIGVDPNSGLVELPTNVVDPTQKIATGCTDSQDNSFVATGRGGMPDNPTQQMGSDRAWEDIRDLRAFRQPNAQASPPATQQPTLLVEATSWHYNADGSVELIAQEPFGSSLSVVATCSVTTLLPALTGN